MEKVTAVIKCNAGEWEVFTSLPFGKPKVVQFNKKNNFTAEIEKEVTFVDAFGRTKVHHSNWPQHLLDNYPFLELVEIKKDEPIVAPVIVDKNKKKGTKDEKGT